jgi:hypothetical protein
MAVVAVLVFVAAYILVATERVPKSRALLLADLSGRGFCSGSKTREGGPMDGKCKPEAAHSSHVWRCACAHENASTEVYAKSDRGCQGLRRAGTGSRRSVRPGATRWLNPPWQRRADYAAG